MPARSSGSPQRPAGVRRIPRRPQALSVSDTSLSQSDLLVTSADTNNAFTFARHQRRIIDTPSALLRVTSNSAFRKCPHRDRVTPEAPMTEQRPFYHDGMRALQDRFDGRRVAERLAEHRRRWDLA